MTVNGKHSKNTRLRNLNYNNCLELTTEGVECFC